MTSLLTTLIRAESGESASVPDAFFMDDAPPSMLGSSKPGVGLGALSSQIHKIPKSQLAPLSPGGLANAFAAATASNQSLQQTHPSDRPQPGTSHMRDLFALPWNSVYFNASYGNVPWPVRMLLPLFSLW